MNTTTLPNNTLTTQNKTREFTVMADKPKSYGGNDTAPTPTEILLAALGSCMAITMRLYAERKEWDTGEISIETRYDDSNNIHKKVKFTGNLTEAQKQRIISIGERCPVAKIIKKETSIQTAV